jgi:Second Messenger Oligonucleotide or Dinucleotide Synthetase domain
MAANANRWRTLMATASATTFAETFEAQLDDLLFRICKELQLDDTRYSLAERSYESVGRVMEANGAISKLQPLIYPQGSMSLRTTVKPLVGDEYDLDFVCEFSSATDAFRSPVAALDLIEFALKSNGIYASMIRRKNRCVRLNYAHEFHLDILPACRDLRRGGTCILVPDRKLEAWTPTNPKGYIQWFELRSQRRLARSLDKAMPLPELESAHQKPPLKLCVQLLKRWRDVRFSDSMKIAPISVVLTTLAGMNYRGDRSLSQTMGSILTEISKSVRSAFPRLVVVNPTNVDEDFSDCWDSQPEAYRAFVAAIAEFSAQWNQLLLTRGIDKVARILEGLFGEDLAKNVVEKQTMDVQKARSSGTLGMKGASGILTAAVLPSVIPVRPTTFYGDSE